MQKGVVRIVVMNKQDKLFFKGVFLLLGTFGYVDDRKKKIFGITLLLM